MSPVNRLSGRPIDDDEDEGAVVRGIRIPRSTRSRGVAESLTESFDSVGDEGDAPERRPPEVDSSSREDLLRLGHAQGRCLL